GPGSERLASCGHARAGMEVAILDEEQRRLPPGETGEICIKGPALMNGYWKKPEATAETLRNGWLHTGDIGKMDEAGYFFILDRSKDMVISGGLNVYPREIEEVLLTHPAISQAAVIGVPDPKWGEAVKAVVVADAAAGLTEAAVAALSPLASVRPAVADDRPQIVDVTDHCPVPEGGYRYGSDFFEYRIRVSLAGCPWYHGEAVTVRGRLVRTDPLTGPEEYDAIVLCEPGAPAGDDRPHDHQPTFVPPPVAEPAPAAPAPTGGAEAHQSEARRPP